MPPRKAPVETWLREQVVPAAIELARDPSKGLTPAQVREHLARKRQKRDTAAELAAARGVGRVLGEKLLAAHGLALPPSIQTK